jgi:hypothetical protein
MLQARVRLVPVDPFAGTGSPNTGWRLFPVVKVYHRRVYRPLPKRSVAFTHTLYVVKGVSPERDNDFVPFDAPVALFDCPLLHWIDHEKRSPSGSAITILQPKLSLLVVEPFVGAGVPKTGGRFAVVVNRYHLRVY